MTGPIIPAGEWPTKAVMHSWDRPVDGVEGEGYWTSYDEQAGAWVTLRSGLPIPAGWDWRVPVMRPQPAPAIDLEQFRELLNQWKGSEYPLSYEGTHSQRALNACITDLEALIDGQGQPPITVTDEMVERACAAFTAAGRRERVLPSLSPRWMREALESALQPTKGEGVAHD